MQHPILAPFPYMISSADPFDVQRALEECQHLMEEARFQDLQLAERVSLLEAYTLLSHQHAANVFDAKEQR